MLFVDGGGDLLAEGIDLVFLLGELGHVAAEEVGVLGKLGHVVADALLLRVDDRDLPLQLLPLLAGLLDGQLPLDDVAEGLLHRRR